MTLPRIECPVCGRNVPLTSNKKFKARIREHKPDPQSTRVCRATGFREIDERLTEIAAEVRAGKMPSEVGRTYAEEQARFEELERKRAAAREERKARIRERVRLERLAEIAAEARVSHFMAQTHDGRVRGRQREALEGQLSEDELHRDLPGWPF